MRNVSAAWDNAGSHTTTAGSPSTSRRPATTGLGHATDQSGGLRDLVNHLEHPAGLSRVVRRGDEDGERWLRRDQRLAGKHAASAVAARASAAVDRPTPIRTTPSCAQLGDGSLARQVPARRRDPRARACRHPRHRASSPTEPRGGHSRPLPVSPVSAGSPMRRSMRSELETGYGQSPTASSPSTCPAACLSPTPRARVTSPPEPITVGARNSMLIPASASSWLA